MGNVAKKSVETKQSTLDLSREEWLDIRKTGIGGSDVAAIFGLNKYKTAFELWQEKTGRKSPADLSENEAVIFGNLLENAVADRFMQKTGLTVRNDNKIRRHKEYTYLLGNIDRLIERHGDKKTPGILEIKTTNYFTFRDDWDNGNKVPLPYYVQLQHYFAVTGYEFGYFAVLVDSRRFEIIECNPDWDYIEKHHIPLLTEWYQKHIVNDTPPEPTAKDVQEYFEVVPKSVAYAADYLIAEINELKSLESQIKDLESKAEEIKDKVRVYMQDKETLLDLNEKTLATYKTQKSNRFDSTKLKAENPEIYNEYTKETISRVLRISK